MDLKKYVFFTLLVILAVLAGCLLFLINHNKNSDSLMSPITQHKALQIARWDAEQVYRDLSIYQVEVHEDGDFWYIDYELKDSQMTGGGPHYVISKTDGVIVNKRYEQ